MVHHLALGKCWLPSRLARAPARTERLSLCTVKRISRRSENRNLTGALGQQVPRPSQTMRGEGRPDEETALARRMENWQGKIGQKPFSPRGTDRKSERC